MSMIRSVIRSSKPSSMMTRSLASVATMTAVCVPSYAARVTCVATPSKCIASSRSSMVRSLSTAATTAATSASPPLVLSEQKGNVLYITINRADLHNAFDEHVIASLTNAFTSINAKAAGAPRVVVLSGAGQSFSAGADLGWMKKMASYSEEQNHQDSLKLFDMVNSIKQCPLPVIARVTGACFGGGGGLVAACDFAFALNTAKFGFTETSLGLLPAVISRFVIDKIGRSAASRYFLTAERFSADVAKQIGLVSEVHATEEELDKAIAASVAQLARAGPNAIRLTKQLIDEVSKLPSASATRDYTTRAIAAARVSAEGQDGLGSFFAKKSPSWVPAKPKAAATK